MAEQLGSAVLTLSVDDARFQAGLNAAKANAQQTSGQIKGAFDGISGSLRGLAGVAGVVGIGAITQQIISTGQASQQSKIQLQSLAGAYGEAAQAGAAAARVQQVLGISALDARQGFAQLYASLRGTGVSLQQLEVLFVGISNAARLSGAGTQEAQAALLQLKQGLASGVLQGDELRSVLEQLPAFAQAVATQLGANVGQLRQLGSEGKITSDVIINAARQLAGATTPGRTELEKLGIAFTNVREAAAEAFGPALVGILRTTAAGFQALSQYLSENREKLTVLGQSVVALVKGLAPFAAGILAIKAAMDAWSMATKAVAVAQAAVLALQGPRGWALLAVGIAAAGGAAIGLEKILKGVGNASAKAKEEAKKAAAEFQNMLAGGGAGGGGAKGAAASGGLGAGLEQFRKALSDLQKELESTPVGSSAFNGLDAAIVRTIDNLRQLESQAAQIRFDNIQSGFDDRQIALSLSNIRDQLQAAQTVVDNFDWSRLEYDPTAAQQVISQLLQVEDQLQKIDGKKATITVELIQEGIENGSLTNSIGNLQKLQEAARTAFSNAEIGSPEFYKAAGDYIEAGDRLKEAGKYLESPAKNLGSSAAAWNDAIDRTQQAAASLRSGLEGSFKYLTDEVQSKVLDAAKTDINRAVRAGLFSSSKINFKDPGEVLSAGRAAQSVNDATGMLTRSNIELSQSVQNLIQKNWNVSVAVNANTGAYAVNLG